ncbi:hypothetical protein [Pseudoxanthomonas sp.]|jgi:hypothetical protein|uniref:hypothetical protein n=1 Tax=Pseudoxanthomonas sp. TaxID=1871049 RepID=UPI002E0FB586|nr:hypothetical protein [Pseudoxanthomonas sp.]
MKVPAAVTILLLLSGCAHWFGPAHGKFIAVGITPTDESCKLSVAPVGSTSSAREWTVSGSFRQSVLINPNSNGHRMTLICDGRLAAERTFKYGRDVGIGGELAVNGSAP